MFRPSRSSNMVQVEIGLFSLKRKVGEKVFRKKLQKHLWDASSVSLMPSSQIWRVSLVSPSSPTLFIKPFASIWPSLQVIHIERIKKKSTQTWEGRQVSPPYHGHANLRGSILSPPAAPENTQDVESRSIWTSIKSHPFSGWTTLKVECNG